MKEAYGEMKQMGKRAICLLLALELYCAPVAMAQARGGLRDERRETPAELPVSAPLTDAAQEFPAAPTSPRPSLPVENSGDRADLAWDPFATQDSYDGYFKFILFAYGLPLEESSGFPEQYDFYYTYELNSDNNHWTNSLKNSYCAEMKDVDLDNDQFMVDNTAYTVIPEVGRMPDMKFDGFYVYENDTLLDTDTEQDQNSWAANMGNWSYDKLQPQDQPIRFEGNLSPNEVQSIENAIKYYDPDVILDDDNRIANGESVVKLDRTYGKMDSTLIFESWTYGIIQSGVGALPLVGRWLPSDRAEMTQLKLFAGETEQKTAYTANFAHKNLGEVADTAFSMDDYIAEQPQELWLRVDKEQTSVTVQFEAYEPYYDYLKSTLEHQAQEATAPCPVEVTATYGDEKTAIPAEEITITGEMVNGARWDSQFGGVYTPQNNTEKPARSLWTVEVPLSFAQGDADPFNTITITLTAPDGMTKITRVFHVERLTGTGSSLGYGNSPLGTIERDNSANWSNKLTDSTGAFYVDKEGYEELTLTTDIIRANKDFARAHFMTERAYHEAYYPLDSSVLQSGTVFKGTYFNCWGSVNYDMDDKAVFAYLDSAFLDPGVTFTDSEGRTVVFGENAKEPQYRECVTRSIQLRQADALTVDHYAADQGVKCWYAGNNTLSDQAVEVPLKNAGGSDQVDLRGLNIVPGTYDMVYTFIDPVSGAVETISRKLIILPSPGDVDMDGAVTALDATVLGENLAQWGSSSDPVMKVIRSRVMDRDHNNLLDQSDVTATYQGFQPQKTGRSYGGDYFYIPLPQGDSSAYRRQTWQQVNASSANTADGRLTLKFLGVETGQRDLRFNTGITNNIAGPWAVDPEELGIELPDPKSNFSGNDTFWMGVYLEPDELAGREVKDFTVTLIYDERYVAPAAVYSATQYEAMQLTGATGEKEKWEATLRYFNFRAGGYDGGRQKVLWATNEGGSSLYELSDATNSARSYDTSHYSKVISTMEGRVDDVGHLKEMVFSIQGNGNSLVTLEEGYVLVVPFRLREHPQGVQEGGTTRLIELSAGMRDLNMVSSQPQRSFFASLFSSPTQVSSAFSGQATIYGGVTENLREKLAVDVEDEDSLVKVGVDRSETIELFNQQVSLGGVDSTTRAKYDTAFECGTIMNGDDHPAGLPEGLEYDRATGLIHGSPTQVGTFTFAIRGKRYKIVVEPRTIRYYADSVMSFYGEEEFRGNTPPSGEIEGDELGRSYRTFTFKYYDRDIAPRDKLQATEDYSMTWNEYTSDAQVGVGRDGAELMNVLTDFITPTFVAASDYDVTLNRPEGIITSLSPASTDPYTIYTVREPSAKNYIFEYVSETPQKQMAGQLTIVKRPIYLDYMEVSAEHIGVEVYHDMGTASVQNITASSTENNLIFTLNGRHEDPDNHTPLTGNALIAGDELTLRFNGRYLRSAYDAANSDKNFVLQDERETRQLQVSNIELVSGVAAGKNYELKNPFPYEPLDQTGTTDVQGWVRRRGVEEVAIYQYPREISPQNPRTMQYGEGVSSPASLMVYIKKGTGATADTYGNYQYNSEQARDLGLHYNWVTPEEYEQGKDNNTLAGTGRYMDEENWGKDMRPYGNVRDGATLDEMPYNTFTPAQTGWRLCISVGKYATGTNELEYIKLYSNPITVQPRQLILEPVAVNRYYGDSNGELNYTYAVTGLLPADREAIQAQFGKVQGTREELCWLLEREQAFYDDFNDEFNTQYQVAAPTICAQKSADDAEAVDETTPAAALPYAIVLSGGTSVNYQLAYRYPQGSGTGVSTTKGWSTLTIHKRPIVVDSVIRDEGFANIYADTVNLIVSKNEPLSPTEGEVTFKLPTQRGEASHCPNYYVNYNIPGYPTLDQYVESRVPFRDDSAPALVNGDEERLSVEYSVTFIPDKLAYNDFTNSYYPVENFKSDDPKYDVQADGSRLVDVQVDKLTLSGAAAENYQLVYESSYNAQQRTPAAVHGVTGPNPNAQAGLQDAYTYQASGKGVVWLRPIKDFSFTSLGKMDYVYGETFTPDVLGTSGSRMTLTVAYETEYDNDLAHNVSQERVEFQPTSTGTTLTDRGFTLGYVKDGQTIAEANANGQYLTYLQYLYPGEHNNARLWIKGQRSEENAEIFSTNPTNGRLTVRKKPVTLVASDVHRFYGEPNETADKPFAFTVLAQDLAQPELDALDNSQPGLNDRVEGTALAQVVEGYKAPTFTTNATPGSPVGEGKWGTYDLTMTSGGSWDNYSISTQNAHIYVYPRPIQVSGITSSDGKPVYTIFHNTHDSVFPTQLGTAQDDDHAEVLVERFPGDRYSADLSNGSANVWLPISGSALYGSDQLTFNVDVTYIGFDANQEDFEDQTNLRTSTHVKSIVSNNNYFLIPGSNTTYETVGAAKLRSIESIHIISAPKLTYTYGEPLDLSGLRVQITYVSNGTETLDRVYANYQGKEQFQSLGLYVNYYDKTWLPDQSTWKDVPDLYRTAATGDHVTIAPTHDTQGSASPFAANGKNLIISAFQAGMGQDPATPIILGENVANYYEGTPTPIVVKPRQLTYTLSADDKTYDGTGATSGTLTLTNVYQRAGLVDAYNGQGVTDVVYVPVGASYESTSTDQHSAVFTAFKTMVQNGQVSFTTGSCVPNSEAPLLENGHTDWSANGTQGSYTHGTGKLDFTFVNPNVHYEDDTFEDGLPGLGSTDLARYWANTQAKNTVTGQWDEYRPVSQLPVAVTNMILAGPDAANYTWGSSDQARVAQTSVTVETRARTENGQAAAPYATIHKANRSTIQTLAGSGLKLPSLGVENHTNIVRLYFDQSLNVLGDNNNRDKRTENGAATTDDFRDELHFEYALYYKDEDTGLYRQWAGRTGDKPYQDTVFFGGEPVVLWNSTEYLPTVNQLPKPESANENTIYKGQRYLWAALDTGLSDRGYMENSGFVIDPSAYPGGADFRDAYWFYDLYTTDRDALPRDTVFYPLVRLSETHNYNASGSLTGDAAVTAELLDAAQKALSDYQANTESEESLAALQAASEALFATTGEMADAAQEASQKRMEEDAAIGEEGRWPDDPPTYENRASAVKTYIQRMDLVSSERRRSDSQLTQDTTEYLVKTLEAVWFTDTLTYQEQKNLDVALYNHPTRYYGYYFDVDQSARINFSEQIFTLEDVISDIPVRVRQEDGTTLEGTITVNQDHTITIYVETSNGDDRKVRYIELGPSVLNVTLGTAPILLEVITEPILPSNRRYRWESSDPSVATVDENGLVTFRGLGTAVITIYTDNSRSATCVVTVTEALVPKDTGRLFNTFFTGSYMELDGADNFYPKKTMTRGELVLLLDMFCRPGELWHRELEIAYVDVTYRERYAEALRRMTRAGVVEGVPGGAFEGEREASRAEFATMMARFLELAIPDTSGQRHAFRDSGEGDTWAYAYIDALAQARVVQGVGNGDFQPNRPVTREEVAAVLARLLTVPMDEDREGLNIPADVTPENWSYTAILRAVNEVDFPVPTEFQTEEA